MTAPSIEHRYAHLQEVVLHYVEAGEGHPLLLLHGWPQTWWEWRHVIPRLAQRYRVIAPDLRGLGDSSRPLDGYDKRTLAADLSQLMKEHLGIERFHLVGHDWGGPTAFALAIGRQEAVSALAILDVVVPGDGGDGFSQGGRRWHHAFHMTPDLPEALTAGREEAYLGWFYRTFSHRPEAIGEEDLREYLRTYRQPGAMRAGFSLYRALPRDVADNQESLKRGRLRMPTLAVGGAESWGRRDEVGKSLRLVAESVEETIVADCGHFIPEEQPQVLAERLLGFFDGVG